MREGRGKRYRNAIVNSRRSSPDRAPAPRPDAQLARHRASRARIAAPLVRIACGIALALPAQAWAGLYKCSVNGGAVMYQEEPCPPGTELRDFERDPATVSVIPFRVVPNHETPPSPPAAQAKSKPERKPRKGDEHQGNASERKFLMPGINQGEVIARIGRPDVSSGGGRKTMRWTYMPAPDDPATITTLTFELGRLVQVERKVVPAR